MTLTEPKFTGKRINVIRNREELTVTISQQVTKWQEIFLLVWIIGWTFCGAVFLYEAFTRIEMMERVMYALLSAMWLYFFYRITRVYIWRRMGKEVLRFSNGMMEFTNRFGSKGTTESFSYHNIFRLGIITRDPGSIFSYFDESFWVIGGERVGFHYSGSKYQLGKQLSLKEAEMLIRIMDSGMKEYKEKKQS